MHKTDCFLISFLFGCFSAAFSQPVNITYDKKSPQAAYAAETLKEALVANGYTLNSKKAAIVITLGTNAKKFKEEAYAINGNGNRMTITGGDNRE